MPIAGEVITVSGGGRWQGMGRVGSIDDGMNPYKRACRIVQSCAGGFGSALYCHMECGGNSGQTNGQLTPHKKERAHTATHTRGTLEYTHLSHSPPLFSPRLVWCVDFPFVFLFERIDPLTPRRRPIDAHETKQRKTGERRGEEGTEKREKEKEDRRIKKMKYI